MDINPEVITKNLGTFANAYGLDPNSKKLVEDIANGNGYVENVGILLRDPVTKKGLISCHFPVNGDIANRMLWVPIDGKPVEAVPIYTRQAGIEQKLKNMWKRLKDRTDEESFYEIEDNNLSLRVHPSFCKRGVIEKYISKEAYGFIRRNRKGIFFMKKWCNFEDIQEGKEVSFIPIISRRGLQARAVEEVILL